MTLLRGTTHMCARVPGPRVAFQDRADAGRALAAFIAPAPDPAALVFALPRGGVPIARPLADVLGCELRPALVRKLAIPSEPEMGFGAVAVDGTVTLNGVVVAAFRIDEATVRRVAEQTRLELERRANAYPGGWPLPEMRGRAVWLVDDGLATGFSAVAAVGMLRAQTPASLRLAVPCAPATSLARLAAVADEAWCLYVQEGRPFAVASFYRSFPDLTDAEVSRLLAR